MNDTPGEQQKDKGFIFQLFIAGDEPNSQRAQYNLRKLCESHINGPCNIEIVNVLESYEIALKNNIFLTPALLMLSPTPAVTVFGDLSDSEELTKALRLEGLK